MKELEFPFDSDYILQKRKKIKKEILSKNDNFINKKIAILGGSSTHDIKEILDLFLLNHGIKVEFYESEYNQYWQDIMFDNAELMEFKPDLIFIHTSFRNITKFPQIQDSKDEVDNLLKNTYEHFEKMWQKISQIYKCPIVQNNFELPFYRILGNSECYMPSGKINFVNRLNIMFATYANEHENFYINDLNYIASSYGLEKFSDVFYWHMYKYALAIPAIPLFAHNLANIIKAIYGKNKKVLVLDLDNTLWGGVVGDDGADNIEIGQETATAQLYSEFQSYIKAHKDIGILLTINSKNDEKNALDGLNRPDSVLCPDDFALIKANWQNKDLNLKQIADTLNLGIDSLVFVDDNPAERHIIKSNIPAVSVPEISENSSYITTLDKSGFFEVISLSKDDLERNEMYKANAKRVELESSFADYKEYLKSLEMKAQIAPFCDLYMARIAQLTNKTNQFNLTTKRCSQSEIENIAKDDNYITLYGKLTDKFGDNGVVSVVFGHLDNCEFHIDLWLMSCRVLKRDMECAMMDELVTKCKEKKATRILGYYYPSAKNAMVKEFYANFGFVKINEDENANTIWVLDIAKYSNKNNVIKVN